MNCPHCDHSLDEIGVVVQATQLFNISTASYSSVQDIEDTLEYYCPECGNTLPFDSTHDFITITIDEEDSKHDKEV